MKLVIAATGASGAIYLQRLLTQIDCAANEVHLVMSAHAGIPRLRFAPLGMTGRQ